MAFIVAGAIRIITGETSFMTHLTSLGGLSTVVLLFNNSSTELMITDTGLHVDQSISVWDDLAGYRLTHDEVHIVREQWYLPNRQFERAEISDKDAH